LTTSGTSASQVTFLLAQHLAHGLANDPWQLGSQIIERAVSMTKPTLDAIESCIEPVKASVDPIEVLLGSRLEGAQIFVQLADLRSQQPEWTLASAASVNLGLGVHG